MARALREAEGGFSRRDLPSAQFPIYKVPQSNGIDARETGPKGRLVCREDHQRHRGISLDSVARASVQFARQETHATWFGEVQCRGTK